MTLLRSSWRPACGAGCHGRCSESLAPRVEVRCGPGPAPIVDGADVRIVAEDGQHLEQVRVAPLGGEVRGELRRASHLDLPVLGERRDLLEVQVVREHRRRRLRAPAGDAGKPIRGITHQRQVVRDGRRWNPELRDHAGLVADRRGPAVELDHPVTDDALAEVLVRGADDRLIDALVGGADGGRTGESVVGFDVDHRPHRDPERTEGVLQHRELREQLRVHALTGLVAGPELVAKRLDHVIGRDTDVGRTSFEHHQHGAHNAARRRHLHAVRVEVGRNGEVVTEQLVGSVDEVDLHGGASLAQARSGPHQMQGSPAVTSRPARHPNRKSFATRFAEGDTYGTLLVLIVVAYVIMAVTEDSKWSRTAVGVAFGAALLLALHTSHVRGRIIKLAAVIVGAAVLWSFSLALFDREPFIGAGHITVILIVVAPGVILYRIFRHPVINVETILGAIDAYLLLGISFAAIYRMLDGVDPHFFTQGAASGVKYLYFSFVVITTLGFGDLTPRTDIGRVVVSLEALLGQIFLVTIVAVLVTNLGRATRLARSPVVDPADDIAELEGDDE